MPELPEVETIRMDLEKAVVGATIIDFSSNSPKQIIPSLEIVKNTIIGAKIVGVERRAKLIILQLSKSQWRIKDSSRPAKRGSNNNFYIAIHLKMTGRLLLRKKEDMSDPFTRAVFCLVSYSPVIPTESRLAGRMEESFSTDWVCKRSLDSPFGLARDDKESKVELRFCDTRKFGYIRLFKDRNELDNFLKDFGPEPFSNNFTAEYLQKILSNKSASIKTCLMDQSIISGVGNIYANEALFLARVLPTRPAKSLVPLRQGFGGQGEREIEKLRKSIVTVLKKGIVYRGSSAKDESYRDLYGSLGNYQNHFLVYQRRKCQKCQSVIEYQRVNGRGTFWCPVCQR